MKCTVHTDVKEARVAVHISASGGGVGGKGGGGALHIRMGLPAGLFAREVLQPMFEVRLAGVCGRLTFPFFLRNCHRRCYGLYLHLFCTWSSGFRFALVGVQGELSRIGTSWITFSERNTLSARFFTRRPGGVPQGLWFVQEGKRSRYLNHSIALLTHLFFLEQLYARVH